MAGRGELPKSQLGRRLKSLRESRGWTQKEAAEKIGVHFNTVARIEREEIDPTASFVVAAARAFGVDCTVLLGPDASPPPASPHRPRGRPPAGGTA